MRKLDGQVPVRSFGVNGANAEARAAPAAAPASNPMVASTPMTAGHSAGSTASFAPTPQLDNRQMLSLQVALQAINSGAAIPREALDSLPKETQTMLVQEQAKSMLRKTEALMTSLASQRGSGGVGY